MRARGTQIKPALDLAWSKFRMHVYMGLGTHDTVAMELTRTVEPHPQGPCHRRGEPVGSVDEPVVL